MDWKTAITEQARRAMTELLDIANPEAGELVVVGCSSSEIVGAHIGKGSSPEAAEAVLAGICPVIAERGLFLATQCCEHLNRALIMEKEAARRFGYEIVSVVPQPKAGGSLSAAWYRQLKEPVAVETVKAAVGLDIGGTLIGMHLRAVAVPVRLSVKQIGEAPILCARTRPKYIGGARAVYGE
ncbi:MAG: TIGR01440 family protein [Clostridia bacterium]|nr:TIGR01440 family protein [Clostridia bacterium]